MGTVNTHNQVQLSEVDQYRLEQYLRKFDFTVYDPCQQLVVEVPEDFTVNSSPLSPNLQAGVTKVEEKTSISPIQATYLVYLVLKCAEEIYTAILFFSTQSKVKSKVKSPSDLNMLTFSLCWNVAKVVTEFIKEQPPKTQKFILNMVLDSMRECLYSGDHREFKEKIIKKIRKCESLI